MSEPVTQDRVKRVIDFLRAAGGESGGEDSLAVFQSGLNRTRSARFPMRLPISAEIEPAQSDDARTTKKAARGWDRQDYVRRIRTYRAGTWFAKPSSASPMVCALLGYINSAPDEVSCEVCGAKVALVIDDALEPEAVEQLVVNFQRQLTVAHQPYCKWRVEQCSLGFLLFPSITHASVIDQQTRRFKSILDCALPLPFVQLPSEVAENGIDMDEVAEFTFKAASSSSTELDPRRSWTAAVLAAFGWFVESSSSSSSSRSSSSATTTAAAASVSALDASISAATAATTPSSTTPLKRKISEMQQTAPANELRCELCCIAVPLGMPIGSSSTSSPSGVFGDNAMAIGDVSSADSGRRIFDPIAEHRWFCPWVTGISLTVVPFNVSDTDSRQSSTISAAATQQHQHSQQQESLAGLHSESPSSQSHPVLFTITGAAGARTAAPAAAAPAATSPASSSAQEDTRKATGAGSITLPTLAESAARTIDSRALEDDITQLERQSRDMFGRARRERRFIRVNMGGDRPGWLVVADALLPPREDADRSFQTRIRRSSYANKSPVDTFKMIHNLF